MTKSNQVCMFKVEVEHRFKDQLLMSLSELNCAHIKGLEKSDMEEKTEEKDPIRGIIKDLRYRFDDLLKKLNIPEYDLYELKVEKDKRIRFGVNDFSELINHILEEINFYTNRVTELNRYIAKAKIELENLNIIKSSYEFLKTINLNRDSLSNLNELKFRVFTTYTKNLSNLQNLFDSNEFPCIYQTSKISEERLVYFIIYPRFNEEKFKGRIKLIHSEEIPILKKYLTAQGINSLRIKKEIEFNKESLIKYENELTKIGKDHLLKFAAINEVVQNVEEYNWAEHQFETLTLNHILFRFFIPIKKKEEVRNSLYNIFKENINIEIIDIPRNQSTYETKGIHSYSTDKKGASKEQNAEFKEKEKEKLEEEEDKKDLRDEAPTILNNRFPVSPYETVLKLYGTPAYSEIDPTPFLAFTFPFLFGIMFGDVGHGFILIIAGLLGALKFRKRGGGYVNMSWIIFFCGWSAMFFGFMYGEIFGKHELAILGQVIFKLEPTIMPLFNVSLHSPLHNIMTVFFFAVTIGVYHINLGWFIQFLNYWKQKRRYMAFADSLMKILLLTGGTVLIFNYGFNIMNQWLAPPYPILLTVIPGLLLLLLKPLGKLFKISYLQEESFGGLIGEGSIEAFETVLSVMSNVASYIRLLAMALAHIALLLSFNAMAEMIQGEGIFIEIARLPGLIIGNFVVILLEGLLVFLNTMRLHFYEFFFKFYQGTGIEYFPFYLDDEYSIIKFQIGAEKDLISEEIEKVMERKTTQEDIEEALNYISKHY